MTRTVPRHRTAIARGALPRPLSTALDDAIVTTDSIVFDYGCGRGTDLHHLAELNITANGWDPAHRSDSPPIPAQVVNLGFVLNVIEDPGERVATLRDAWNLAQEVLIVSARMTWDARGLRGRPRATAFSPTQARSRSSILNTSCGTSSQPPSTPPHCRQRQASLCLP
ncbi:DNA phosphorothioation-associated putative methyltransferase [Amycolatopsis japonica]|uniref:DNA phosphorothioation-associated putative methyltransferase n=1 Tax=Amycolatopsis japonica TaxID=208439 RepID=UPI000A008902